MSVLVEYPVNSEKLARSLSRAERHALLRMTEDWQTASHGMFRVNGARYLMERHPGLCERILDAPDGKGYIRVNRYRLTALGTKVWDALVGLGLDE